MSQLIARRANHQAGSLGRPSMGLALYVALGALCTALPHAATAGPDPQVVRGEQLARIACSHCHVVAPDQGFSPTINVSAPPFEDIANRHNTTEQSLQRFISTTHWDGQTMPMTMPAPGLSQQETRSIIRYIMSLKKP